MSLFIHGLSEMFIDGLSAKTGIDLYPLEKRRADKFWGYVMGAFLIFGILPMFIVDKAVEDSDLLSGETAVRSYYNANMISMVFVTLEFMVWVVVLYTATQKKPHTGMKALCFIFSFIFIIAMGVHYTLATSKMKDDLKNPTVTTPEEYVLCKSDKKGDVKYYIGFEYKGDFPMLEIPFEDHQRLGESGEIDTRRYGSDIFDLVNDAGYSDAKRYSNADESVSIEYYFNSAIYIGLK